MPNSFLLKFVAEISFLLNKDDNILYRSYRAALQQPL